MGWLNQYIHEEPSDELVEPGDQETWLGYYVLYIRALLAVMVSASVAGNIRTNGKQICAG